jgi:hypothetical protein
MSKLSTSAACIAALAGASLASAAITVDGTRDPDYGAPIAVQLVGTQFGNSNLGQIGPANGSELDAAYGVVQGSNLHIFLSGNLETNFNKIEIFFDSIAGGQNKLRGDNPDVDFNGLNRMGDDGSGNGLRFDTGFESDFYLTATGGNNPVEWFANFAETLTAGGGTGSFIGGSGAGNQVINGSNGIVLGFNNSNTGGVGSFGNPPDSDPATVTTGIEVLVPLSLLGNPGDVVRISAFVNGGGHDFMSNQVMGPLPDGTGNLGEPRGVDFNQFAGNQYFTVVIPEPASLGVVGAGALVLVRRRRRGLR